MRQLNIIEVYVQDKPICDDWQMGGAVIGIQDMDAIRSVTPDQRNNGQWGGTGINEAWRFTPNGDPNYSIEWSDDSGNIVGDTESITVSPKSQLPTEQRLLIQIVIWKRRCFLMKLQLSLTGLITFPIWDQTSNAVKVQEE